MNIDNLIRNQIRVDVALGFGHDELFFKVIDVLVPFIVQV